MSTCGAALSFSMAKGRGCAASAAMSAAVCRVLFLMLPAPQGMYFSPLPCRIAAPSPRLHRQGGLRPAARPQNTAPLQSVPEQQFLAPAAQTQPPPRFPQTVLLPGSPPPAAPDAAGSAQQAPALPERPPAPARRCGQRCTGLQTAPQPAKRALPCSAPQADAKALCCAWQDLLSSPRQPAELLHGKAGLQGAVDAARQQGRAVGDDAVQCAGRDHKVCALLRLHQGGDARRHHRHA